MKINKIKTKHILWTHVNQPTKKEVDQLKEIHNFHPLDLEDCLVRIQRPQISEYPHYIFFILTFPVYNRNTKEIESSEIDFFIGPKYLVTLSDGGVSVVNNFFNEIKTNEYSREKYMSSSHPINLVYELLHRLQSYALPMLDHISRDIEEVEKRIFKGEEKKVVKEILYIKRNIVDFRRIMQAHKNIIKKLTNTHTKSFMPDKTKIYFINILDRTKDIWDILEAQKENINTFQETNESLISYKLNDIMRILTIISVIMIPANLVASIFGVNAKYMPFIGQPFDFYMIIAIMFTVMLLFMIYFRKKDWL
ncbi:MAG: magnesium and cobalt transport protein CorA [Candidatus Komeilibacteria bacterium CG11_big_fil_rev_8_21_14_0_20_36_20]|uniref:Magnesium transport protein CorA n=1 Tax=Candidatus Komeilibacteria bacterium CG11_big_fil_rev_8_21_14_0_20_36_20 TaxID=1974477 RepID=A0A2H0NH17_9BACT|nr:MAG: magnesium and cobalt transport protein CorA [Candidatus Komeilibacteria bacterium CG11_big_fil_rev_8_21_14_0_20_36_20]PIR81186.1 MAG: magnesium and cobalt transport protein CorA [Candidatus Komeilibacteria bacterium CG10_big_fil_rev_8_21_14_0_10_36_65]PJC55754.1 MAG: magnesium and cobalt transport protein CorA [Candidatus Komeilibacteria bacterium CG_4_9_14_0_2_um_filter_36_13]